MQPRSGLVQSADAQIFYLEYPSPHPHAQTLILLHGNGEAHRYFARQIAAFSARFRLVLMDTRGQGRSSAGRGKLNFSVFAQDLLRLMDALHIPKAHLLGFSDGGNLALTFALAHPQRVRSLISMVQTLRLRGCVLLSSCLLWQNITCAVCSLPFRRTFVKSSRSWV